MVTQQSHIINSTKEIFSSYIQNRILIFSNNEKRTSNIYHSLISQSYILAKCYNVELYEKESIYLQWNFKLMLYLLGVATQIRLYNWWRKPEFHTSSPSSKRSIFNPRQNNADDKAITLVSHKQQSTQQQTSKSYCLQSYYQTTVLVHEVWVSASESAGKFITNN